MKTSELIGPALNWAVAKCEGIKEVLFAQTWDDGDHTLYYYARGEEIILAYTTDWAQGGPIIERESLQIHLFGDGWQSNSYWDEGYKQFLHVPMFTENGPTPLIAAMRCYVASKLGEAVEVPAELS